MVRYVSAGSDTISLNDLLNKITPDFNNKLSSILKKASNPTWDLEEIKSKEPEETNIVYFDIGTEISEDGDDYDWVPIQSTIKLYYKGITDSDKIFYVDIEKTMVVRYMENWKGLLGKGFTEIDVDGAEPTDTYISIGAEAGEEMPDADEVGGQKVSQFEQILNYIKDWDDWVDAPGIAAKLDIQYNDANIKEHYEVPVDKIDETIQKFVDKYIDV